MGGYVDSIATVIVRLPNKELYNVCAARVPVVGEKVAWQGRFYVVKTVTHNLSFNWDEIGADVDLADADQD